MMDTYLLPSSCSPGDTVAVAVEPAVSATAVAVVEVNVTDESDWTGVMRPVRVEERSEVAVADDEPLLDGAAGLEAKPSKVKLVSRFID